jgi:radical SAM enzyme (TIGR01210 family)
MANFPDRLYDNEWVRQKRGIKNPVDPFKPYALIREKERSHEGKIEEAATVFLTNKECPFKCLMCDLWKNTTNEKVADGVIAGQIEWAINKLSGIRHLKLYNSGNFFDKQAIPENDYDSIKRLVSSFASVLIENHPKLVHDGCLEFNDSIPGDLEVAIGLETAHPEVLSRLNKQMNLEDFRKAVHFLNSHRIRTRAFILLRPPFLTEEEGVIWAKRSIEFAFQLGVECCVVIPTRRGNGAMDYLSKEGYFDIPRISSLEEVVEHGINLKAGRVFADLWDLEYFSRCKKCFPQQKERFNQINLYQSIPPRIHCTCAA